MLYRWAGVKSPEQRAQWTIRVQYDQFRLWIVALNEPPGGRRRRLEVSIGISTGKRITNRLLRRQLEAAALQELEDHEMAELPPNDSIEAAPPEPVTMKELTWMAWVRRLKALPREERLVAILQRNPQGAHITDIRILMGGTRVQTEMLLHRLERQKKAYVHHYVANEAVKRDLLKRTKIKADDISVVGRHRKLWRLR